MEVNSVMNFNEQLKTEEGCYTEVLKMPFFIMYTWKAKNLLFCLNNLPKACRILKYYGVFCQHRREINNKLDQ